MDNLSEHPIERIIDNVFSKVKGLAQSDTVIGEPLMTKDGVSIIPVNKVTIGIVTGGGEYSDMSRQHYDNYPFAGGSGTGISISPIGFMVNDGNSIDMIKIESDGGFYEKLFALLPKIVSKFRKDKD